MTKKTTNTVQLDEGEIPIRYGKTADQLDRVSIIGKNGKELRLIVYPGEPLLAHMHDWHHVGASFTYYGVSIRGLKLTKAERGFSLRKGQPSRRTHLYITLDDVAVEGVSGPEPDELGDVQGSIANDNAVMFALPKVIEGSQRWYYRISRT
jgi:hypothetical protein